MDFALLTESEQRFRALFENNPDVMLFQNRESIILDANPTFLSLIHAEKSEVVGRSFSEFLPPELRSLFARKLAEAFEGQKVQFDVEVQFIGADAPLSLSATKVPLRVDGRITGVHLIARDVTELFASHRIIREQAQRLNTVFESITDAFFVLDHDLRFTYVNGEVERLLGVSRTSVIDVPIGTVVGEDSEFRQRLAQALESGQAAHFEAFFEKGGRWLEVKAFPSGTQMSVYFADISDKVRSQEEMYRQHKDLQQFTYIVSHNLRAPLANALGLVDLLGSVPANSPDYTLALDNLKTSVQQLDVVLRDMNTILSIRDQQGIAEPEMVPLADVVNQAALNLREPLQQHKGELRVNIPAELRVRANRAYLYSIFFNLLSNSMKYRAEGRPLRVDVTAKASPDGGTDIVVADNGSGFDMEKAGNDVFRLYKRFHTAQPGRGIGLYLVKTHVEAMSGTITVTSSVGVGTQFHLHLP
jgi:PAS domain S-box-containing protein